MAKGNWSVIRRWRGMDGKWFNGDKCAYFNDPDEARKFAEQFATEIAQANGTYIAVRERLTSRSWITVWKYHPEDYRAVEASNG